MRISISDEKKMFNQPFLGTEVERTERDF